MKKFRVFVILLLVITSMTLTSCIYTGYGGEHVDLYTVAVNNVFASCGELSNGEVSHDSRIEIIETDDYGRVLFFYNELYNYSSEVDFGMAFVIMQKSDNEYAYYYSDCYVPFFSLKVGDTADSYESIQHLVDMSQLDALKAANDWNKELDESKFLKSMLTTEKPEGRLRINESEFDEAICKCARENGYTGTDSSQYRFSYYCAKDKSGNELHYAYAMTSDVGPDGKNIYGEYEYAILFNRAGKCQDIIEIKDIENSHSILLEFLERNNWNK